MLKKYAILFLAFVQIGYGSIFDWFSTPLTPKAKQAQVLLDDFDLIIQKALEEFQVPGIAVGVVVDGHLVYSKGFGVRDKEKNLPVTPDTLFAIGSCTKAFTAFACGTLVDEGLLEWDRLVIDVLPEFRLWNEYATQNLTLRDLLTHRSGLPRHDFMWYNSSMDRAEVLRRLRYLEPSCDLRERYQYNNLMYLTVGYAMNQVTGKTWEQLVKERILKPLGMKRTNFSVEEMQKQSDCAIPYIEKKGILRKMPHRNLSVIGPAGSINSSITELAPWVIMHLNGGMHEGKSLISPATLQEIQAPQVIIPGAPETKETLLTAYGIGWNISSYRGQYLVSHDGGPDGFTSVIALLPQSRVGLILLANKNLSAFPRFLSFQIIDRLLELPFIDWLGEAQKSFQKSREIEQNLLYEDFLHKKETFPSHQLEDYVGNYYHPGYGKLAIELHNGKLQAIFNGITYFLDHYHYDVFAVAEESQDLLVSREEMKFSFRGGVNGDVEDVVIPFECNASDIVFKKVNRDALSDPSYLKRFTGFYEIYGYTVEIAVRSQGLCAVIPGQPLYELIPTAENEFSVKSQIGYNVRFLVDEQGHVEELLLLQPYGALVATPRV